MKILKKTFFAFAVLTVGLVTKLKAQDYYLLYSNAKLKHTLDDTCKAVINKKNNTLILYSRNHIDTLHFKQKDKALLYRYNIGKLLTNGYYLIVNGKSIFLKNGILGIKEYVDKYEIQHYSHASHSSHASHMSHYSQMK
jgi:hypothetical protein